MEESGEVRFRVLQGNGLMGMTAKEVAAAHVAYGQGITVETVSHLEVALVVGTPDIVGLLYYGLRASGVFSPQPSLAGSDESFAFQDVGCR